MTITETLFLPLVAAEPARPLITYYDDADGSRVELSRVTAANCAAKTANFLRDEFDVEPGDAVAVALPAHWQTLGVLLGAWWCGARVVHEPEGARAAFVAPGGDGGSAENVAVVALDPMGMGLREQPGDGALDFLSEVRVHGDDFAPMAALPGGSPTLSDWTLNETVAAAKSRAVEFGIGATDRVLSTMDWTFPDGVTDGLLAVLAAGASLVQCGNLDRAKLPARVESERVTVDLSDGDPRLRAAGGIG